MTNRVFEGLGTLSDSVRKIAAPIGRAFGVVGRGARRVIGGARSVIVGLLPVLAIIAVAGGAYLLFFREEAAVIDYRFANVVGGDGAAVSCIYSNKKPKVNIVRPARGSGNTAKTNIAFNGAAGLTFTDSCGGSAPEMELRSLSMVLPGAIPVKTERVEREQKAGKGKNAKGGKKGKKGKKDKEGKQGKQGKKAQAEGEETTVLGVNLPDFLPL